MTATIGIIHGERPAKAPFIGEDPFAEAVFQGIRDEASKLEFRIIHRLGGERRYLEFVMNSHLDGLIISGPRLDDSKELERLLSNRKGFPVVLQGQLETPVELNSVDVDNAAAAKQAVEHLIQKRGRRRIAVITNASPRHYAASRDRLEGYKQALLEEGLHVEEDYIKFGDFTRESGAEAMRELLGLKEDEGILPPEAVFVASDTVAFGAMEEVRRDRKRIPRDIAIVGFDGLEESKTTSPPLTTMAVPHRELGREAVRMLASLIDGEKPLCGRKLLLRTELQIRESCGTKPCPRGLDTIQVEGKWLSHYEGVVGKATVAEIRRMAEPLRDARVLHVNATAFGGGVAEILYTLVALMRDVGLDTEWQIIAGADEFFDVTKAFHNGLQGMMDLPLTEGMKDIWREYNELNATAFKGEYDFVVVHDPQPAGLLHYHGTGGGKHWIWRCHIDTSHLNPAYWDFLAPYIDEYEAGIFTMEQYVGPGVEFEHLAIITPTIDPLSPKNAPMAEGQARKIVAGFGIDVSRPLITQVSRFDPWKDPLGVIDAYRIVKAQIPEVQLALVGSMASDDPEGWYYLDKTSRHAGEDFDVHILHNFHGVGGLEVGAFQSASDVVVQKSTREGFGMVVTEGLWKGKPVVGGKVGGIPLQVIDGETGFLVDSAEECGEKALYLLQHREEAARMGAAAREHVRRNFLTTRHLADYLRLFANLAV